MIKYINHILILIYLLCLCSGSVLIPNSNSLSSSDEYLANNQKDCFTSRKLLSCFKYKTARYIWSIATNRFSFAWQEGSKALSEDDNNLKFRFIQLQQPTSLTIFPEARYTPDDSEIFQAWKFMKRATQVFLQSHGLSFSLPNDLGARVYDTHSTGIESRGDKKKRKWLIILPLIILMKIAHLKMALLPVILGIAGMQLVLLLGGTYVIYYLKHHTLCRIQPHLVHTHSHVYDNEPEYSTFTGYSGGPSPSYISGQASGYKDWGSNRAYSVYNYHADGASKL